MSTTHGASYVDPYTGEQLSYQLDDTRQGIYEFIMMLHTGEGLWWLGLLLGLCALAVPAMAVTGVQLWWKRRQAMPKLSRNSRANTADIVLLVGSESNSTWGFASTLHETLTRVGYHVHTASMNHLASRHHKAKYLFILTSTYGDGHAPASANRFLARLAKFQPTFDVRFAVLGFGDKQFPKFCQFAQEVEAALLDAGLPSLLPLDAIDRQSIHAFSRWGNQLGQVLGCELALDHTPQRMPTFSLQLAERVDYGEASDAPTSVLRFVMSNEANAGKFLRRRNQTRLPHFEAGDLVGIYPPGSSIQRLYSLASTVSDGQLEICVRKHADGVCSGFLHGLQPGDNIDAFIQPHPTFRPVVGNAPVILIGAGTGIGPLAGFVRNNTQKRPVYLYWGGRDPQSGFLYQPELRRYLDDNRLTQLSTAFSRVNERCYVQDKIMADNLQLCKLIEEGAQVMVCGGRGMADSVITSLNHVLTSLNVDVCNLKAQGRYQEDVY